MYPVAVVRYPVAVVIYPVAVVIAVVVEHFTEINTLCNVASCWLYLKITLPASNT
jgi:hypothetical protein